MGEMVAEFVGVDIGSEVDVEVPAMTNACDGQATFGGEVHLLGHRLLEVRVLVRAGWTTAMPRGDVQNGELASVSGDNWSIDYPSVVCTGGECAGDGKSRIAVEALWEADELDPLTGEPVTHWESGGNPNNFIGNCQFMEMAAKPYPFGPPRVSERRAIHPSRDCAWHFFEIDLNAIGQGTRLLNHAGEPLRAKRIKCYAAGVDWRRNGRPWNAMRSPLGNWKTPTGTSARHLNVFEGAIVVFQPEVSIGDLADRHAALVQVVHSSERREPTVLNVDESLDLWVQVNALPSLAKPHTGSAGIWVKVLE